MYRRVVTDGKVFRVQCRMSTVSDWAFYPGQFSTREAAQEHLEAIEASEAAEAPARWQEVK